MRHADVVAAIPALSGSLTVGRSDGSSVILRPARYGGGPEVVRAIAAGIGEDATVPLTEQERILAKDVERLSPERQVGRTAAEIDSLIGVLAESADDARRLSRAFGDRPAQLALTGS